MIDSSVHILAVDDDEEDVMTIQQAFEKNKIKNPLHMAENGEEALAMLRGDGCSRLTPTPKIILLDLNMPKMGGIEFLKEIRHDPNFMTLKVFVLTTSNSDRDIRETAKFNAAGYIVKPVTFDAFMEAIRTLDSYWTLDELCKY